MMFLFFLLCFFFLLLVPLQYCSRWHVMDSCDTSQEPGRPKCLLKIRGNMRFVPEIALWLPHVLRLDSDLQDEPPKPIRTAVYLCLKILGTYYCQGTNQENAVLRRLTTMHSGIKAFFYPILLTSI